MSSSKAEAEYFSREHVHIAGDGRGPRLAFIDGIECNYVCYADTVLGIAVVAVQPFQVMPGTDYIDQIVLMGDVRIEFKESNDE
ncbi:hypothetical protein G7009_01445 [Pseudomonas capeferrum]|uniref:hypothetical protein n=1 Tax=Pseudomonas capeferrum TaxID=1495066 RepID=UPI0015E35B65|nr:hypothetical protein [Pseudomonas capeferrum]MBA1200467.1 hypothetical protein [Pseudomonas capeferrum]